MDQDGQPHTDPKSGGPGWMAAADGEVCTHVSSTPCSGGRIMMMMMTSLTAAVLITEAIAAIQVFKVVADSFLTWGRYAR